MLSGLTTRGRCLLAAGIAAALCSWVLNERDLLRVAVFVIALPLLVVVFLSASRVRIGATRVLHPPRVAAGDQVDVQLELWRTGVLPAGEVLLEDRVSYSLGTRPRFIVERLPHDHRIPLHYPLRPTLRGVQQIGPLRAKVTDPFGICEFERELIKPSRLMVVPRTERLSGMLAGSGVGAGDEGAARRGTGPGDPDAIVRQYRQGDDLRMVHWPSTARRDELMVRLEQQPGHGGTTVLIDHRAAAHHGTGRAASIEWAVSFAASVCLHLRRAGHRVRLVTEHGHMLADIPPDSGAAYDDVALDALAVLQPAHQRDITLGGDPAVGQELVAVLGSVSNQAIHELSQYRPRGVRSLAVLLDTAAWSTGVTASAERSGAARESARLLEAAGWGVVVADPASSLQQVWTRLCRASMRKPAGAGQS
ncbi:DUF58 domain-containing protein [Thermocrispum municipale]|uniref:DUF58 domain-containing protein n=1 Tax=Thermocrispum municipale TaxID=37926 RepID=UPI00041CB322|nr:DUF58 domain-containing protein [Thermocrispum municipale]